MPQISYPQFHWPAAGTTSAAQRVNGATIAAVRTPAGFAGTSVTFQAADETGSFSAVKNADGTALTLTVSGQGHSVVLPGTLASVDLVRIVSNASEAAGTVVRLAVREMA